MESNDHTGSGENEVGMGAKEHMEVKFPCTSLFREAMHVDGSIPCMVNISMQDEEDA